MNMHVLPLYYQNWKNSRNHFCCCWGEDLWNDGEANCGASYQIRHSPGQGVVWKPGHYLQHNMHHISQWIPGEYGELAPQLLARLWTELWLTTTTLAGSPSTTFFPYRLWEKIFQWQQRKALFHIHICGPVQKVQIFLQPNSKTSCHMVDKVFSSHQIENHVIRLNSYLFLSDLSHQVLLQSFLGSR